MEGGWPLGKDHVYFYKPVTTRRTCTFFLWEGHLLHLSGKTGRKKGSPPNQLTLSQPVLGPTHGATGTESDSCFPGKLQGVAPGDATEIGTNN